MKTIFLFSPSFIFIFGMLTVFALLNKDKLMDKYMRDKVPFIEALEFLKLGKPIRRCSEGKTYVKREIICDGKSVIEYGTVWNYDKKFCEGIRFDLDDVLADDWIIEEKK